MSNTRRSKKRNNNPVLIAAVIVIAAAIVAICFVIFSFLGGDNKGGSVNTEGADKYINEWCDRCLSGDVKALDDGILFDSLNVKDENDDMYLSSEELRELMENEYSDLLDEEVDTDIDEDSELFRILMSGTDISFKLPKKIKDGAEIEFTINGPDMREILGNLDAYDSKEYLYDELSEMVESKECPKRSVSVNVQIALINNEYRMFASAELVDALYGDLASIIGNEWPEPME